MILTPLCTDGGYLGGLDLKLGGLERGAGAQSLSVKATLFFPQGAPPTDGAQLLLEDVGNGDTEVFELSWRTDPIPSLSAPPCDQRDGWRVTASHSRYRNRSGALDAPACTPGSARGLAQLTWRPGSDRDVRYPGESQAGDDRRAGRPVARDRGARRHAGRRRRRRWRSARPSRVWDRAPGAAVADAVCARRARRVTRSACRPTISTAICSVASGTRWRWWGSATCRSRSGDTEADVRALWGRHFTVCSGCDGTTWFYIYPTGDPFGAAVRFRDGRVTAVFTLGAPRGWRDDEGLRVGEVLDQQEASAGDAIFRGCMGYGAKSTREGEAVSSVLMQGLGVYGFALTRPSEPVCQ